MLLPREARRWTAPPAKVRPAALAGSREAVRCRDAEAGPRRICGLPANSTVSPEAVNRGWHVESLHGLLLIDRDGIPHADFAWRQGFIHVRFPVKWPETFPGCGVIPGRNSGEWCNGSTADSESVSLGSNPSSPAWPVVGNGFSWFPRTLDREVRIGDEIESSKLAEAPGFACMHRWLDQVDGFKSSAAPPITDADYRERPEAVPPRRKRPPVFHRR